MATAGVTIAVVEDGFAMRRSIERVLQAHGYLAQPFADAEAFLAAGGVHVKGLSLDVNLPGISGIELQRRLRASGSTLPVVFITAYDEPTTRAEVLVSGCAGYLRKPFEAVELVNILRRAITL